MKSESNSVNNYTICLDCQQLTSPDSEDHKGHIKFQTLVHADSQQEKFTTSNVIEEPMLKVSQFFLQRLDQMNFQYVKLVQQSTNLIKLSIAMTPMIRLLNLSFEEMEEWYQITRNLESNERDTTQLYEDTVAKYMEISKVPP